MTAALASGTRKSHDHCLLTSGLHCSKSASNNRADRWKNPEEMSRNLPAGIDYILYPPRPDAGSAEELLTTSIRWELYRKGLEDVERFFALQRLQERAELAGIATPVAGCGAAALESINDLVWDFPALKQKPWGDGWTPPGWCAL